MDKTVYVVGAGASKEFGLPTGHELKNLIASTLQTGRDWHGSRFGDENVLSALEELCKPDDNHRSNFRECIAAATQIVDALPLAISIDNFVDAHRENKYVAMCAKVAIAKCILEAEAQSTLVKRDDAKNRIAFADIENTWLPTFFKSICENCNENELSERLSKVVFVIFNYDRCVEHFLHEAIQLYYGVTPEESAALLTPLTIYHPYGQIGNLPWQGGEDPIAFGQSPDQWNLTSIPRSLRTFTEGVNRESSNFSEIRRSIGKANRIVFLGFGFHPLNMRVIEPDSPGDEDNPNVRIYCTTKGVSVPDEEAVRATMKSIWSDSSVELDDSTCGDFLYNFSRSLSYAREDA